MPRENTVTNGIIKFVSKQGGKAVKLHTGQFQERGTPDILAALPGYGVVLVEAKADDGQPTAIQIYRLKQWGDAGIWTSVCWTLDGFKRFLDDIKEGDTPAYMGFYK